MAGDLKLLLFHYKRGVVMAEKWVYQTPEGFSDIVIMSEGKYITGLWFEVSKDVLRRTKSCMELKTPPILEAIRWLDIYFSGNEPDFIPDYKISGLTEFRHDVIEIMKEIPYGETITYGEIARTIAARRGIENMSAQAVGGAVGWNPISIIIPCHRVMGANNAITGYGGGIENKIGLLRLEKVLD